MLWIPIIALAASVCGLLVWTVLSRRRAAQLREQSRHRLSQLQHEHEKHIERLDRKLGEHRDRGHLDFARDLFPALDALGHALDQARQGGDETALLQGLEMVDKELDAVLLRHGIQRCSPQPGEAFDPNVHEAVSVDQDSELDAGQITQCLRPGYVHEHRVLRAAAVSVSREPAPLDAGDEEPADNDHRATSPSEEDSDADTEPLGSDDDGPSTRG